MKKIYVLLAVSGILSSFFLPHLALADINSNLQGYWNLDEGSGSTANDISCNANNGSLVGGPSWVQGHIGSHALRFDRSAMYVQVPNSASLNIRGDQITVSAWVFIPGDIDTGTQYAIVDKLSDPSSYTSPYVSYALFLLKGRDPAFLLAIAGREQIMSGSSVSLNAWHHIDGTYNGFQMKLYVDGFLVEKHAQTGNISTFVTPLRIGTNTDFTRNFYGSIDDVRVYNRALSSNDITELFRFVGGTSTPPCLVSVVIGWVIALTIIAVIIGLIYSGLKFRRKRLRRPM